MKIKELHVYGYGKLENKRFTDIGQLQIFFGENESGKTTIMSFIHSLLFGFPTKVQTERRYEPKLNAKYGGRILLHSDLYGEVSIERVKGKATGDVSVTFENGSIGTEEDIKKILQGMDKSYFQSVFSFDLHGLHGVQSISEATLGKYLLSAGMIGNDKLLEAENRLQKVLDARFKPSGQKPTLNVKLNQLKDMQARLKKSDEEQRTYTELKLKQIETEAELSELKNKVVKNEDTLWKYQEFLRTRPLFEEKQTLQARLSEFGDVPFPTDGIKRLEQLLAMKIPNDAQLSALDQKKQENESNTKELNISPYLTANKEKVAAFLEKSPFLESKQIERNKLEQTLHSKQREKQKYMNDLNMDMPDEEIMKLDTSTFTTEKVKELEREKHRLKSERIRIDEKYKQEKNRLELTEARMKELSESRLPDEERKRLEREESSQRNESYASLKKEILEEQIAELTKKHAQAAAKKQGNQKRNNMMTTLLAMICLGITVYAWIGGQFLLGTVSALFAVIAIVSRFFINQNDVLLDLKQQLAEAENKKREYEQQASSGQIKDQASIRHLLQRETETQQQLLAESFKLKDRTAAFDAVLQESESWETSWNEIHKELDALMKKWNMPLHSKEDFHAGAVLEMLVNLKHTTLESAELWKELNQLTKDITEQERELLNISEQLGLRAANWREATIKIKEAQNVHQDQSLQLKQYSQEKKQQEAETERLRSESAFLSAEVNQLFQSALVETEEEFRRKAILTEEKEKIENSLLMISAQLENVTLEREDYEAFSNSKVSNYTVETLEAERKNMLGEQSVLLERLSDLKHQIKQLEEGGTYSVLLYQFNEAKAAFNEEAREWSKYALAKSLLDKTIATFKRERLPKVIVQAEDYLSFLTDGEYKRVLLGETVDGLYLERFDGLRFEAGEVSRGTAEQVYVSLRLALAHHMFPDEGFPILIDDSFVNFDGNRTLNMIKLLQKISETRQVIFFTCHEHLLAHFNSRQITVLERENNAVHNEVKS
ncbi:AAA family ATPase [Bacillus sp. CECT 9360]|uniref:ATP-binding protein n=1 Tax=Bacillus sp. CECT 9360 TaxID=2845821 RepID=UPI001E528EE8|nr:AAA family ATPase [Bacillus sp. CECT 9360]CAH0344374.1 hypothetical protein BCI9360_00627 [Bacillus sp. CECT 9360]